MGQSIAVVRKQTSNPALVRFEINRSLTGMGHERYHSAADAVRHRPVDELARRLFEAGGIEGVHVYSNMVTVDLAPGGTTDGFEDIIRGLFTYYREGVEVAEPTG
jgi:hypothetical protein